jgi:hypothetical protein
MTSISFAKTSLLPNTIPAYVRRLITAALLAAVATLGGSAGGDPATAYAKPAGGSKGAYDECVARGTNKRLCCSLAGGQWIYVITSAGITYQCTGLTQPQTQQPTLVVAPPPVVAEQNPAPPPPIRSPQISQTFAPAPVSLG